MAAVRAQSHFEQQPYQQQAYQAPSPAPLPARRGVRVVFVILIALLCLVLGAAAGALFLGDLLPRPQQTIPATLTADQLDDVVGSYTYKGERHDITAQQALTDSVSLDAVRQADGSYKAPTADQVVSYARNRILADIVSDEGVTVTDDDLNSYLQSLMGTTDIASIAKQYNMGEDQARTILTEAAAVKKLRDQKLGSLPAAPAPPVAPDDGNTETANHDYATYIIGLLGDNWDATNRTWANTDNAYYSALKDATFSADSANYEAAQMAYYVAYANYQSQSGAVSSQWTDYINGYMVDGAITVDTLLS